MYKVIGSDNREYGPAGEDVIRRWIAEGRANGATQVQKEGDPGWRPLSSCPEFAEALAAGAQVPPAAEAPAPAGISTSSGASPSAGSATGGTEGASAGAAPGAPDPGLGSSVPPPPPSPSAAAASALEAELLARDVHLDIGAFVQKSWELFQKQPWLVAVSWAVFAIILTGGTALTVSGIPVLFVVGAVFQAGIHNFFLRLSRGETASVADVFSGFGPSIGPLILCSIVAGLLITLGGIFCIVPGLFLMICWQFAPLLVIDKHLEFWHAMELSRKAVMRHFGPILGLAIVWFLLHLAGTLCCGIVVFVTGPIATGAIVEAYRKLFETPHAGSPTA
jgi:uncharacterized membrane protein